MGKLRTIKLYNTANVPDHVIEEMNKLVEKMKEALVHIIDEAPPNYILGAFSYVYAAMLVALISEGEENYKTAANNAAIGIIKNVESLCLKKGFIKEEWYPEKESHE